MHTPRTPDWSLFRRMGRIVYDEPGGGIHRVELARRLGVRAEHPDLRQCLFVAYSRRLIDFCGQYVVVTTAEHRRSAAASARVRVPGPGDPVSPDALLLHDGPA